MFIPGSSVVVIVGVSVVLLGKYSVVFSIFWSGAIIFSSCGLRKKKYQFYMFHYKNFYMEYV
tara:strand:- start:397 stop:582 length:186 start_codon:yes stop_codon:yes gene_type:complete